MEPNQGQKEPNRFFAFWTKRRMLSGGMLVAGVVLLVIAAMQMRPRTPPQNAPPVEPVPVPSSVSPPSSTQPAFDEEYLKDKLYITTERAAYQTGQLVLKIPRMGVDGAVQNGTTDEAMAVGPCLYDYAQLPAGEGNHNVSVVAHRDIHGAEFYFAHKLGPGDLFYLIYNETIFVYAYEKTYIITPDDWGPIYSQGYPCLTLTTCNPIGSTRERLVVHARLQETIPYDKNYTFAPWMPGMEKPYAWEKDAVSWNAKEEAAAAAILSEAAAASKAAAAGISDSSGESSSSNTSGSTGESSSPVAPSTGEPSSSSEPTVPPN